MSQSLVDRAKTMLLVAAQTDNPIRFMLSKGYMKGLLDASSNHNSELEDKDKSQGGYKPATYLQAAWAALPNDMENITLRDVQQLLSTNGVECARDSAAQSDIDAALHLKSSVVTPVDLNNETTVQVINKTNNTSLHFCTSPNKGTSISIVTDAKGA